MKYSLLLISFFQYTIAWPFPDAVDIPRELAGIWVGDGISFGPANADTGELDDNRSCVRTIFQRKDPGNKLMSSVSSTGSCEESGINQVTGEISGDWFGSIRTDKIFIEDLTKFECNICSDVSLSSDTIDFSVYYDVKARSCGIYIKKDLATNIFSGDAFQVTFLTHKLEDRNLGKERSVRGESPKSNSGLRLLQDCDLPDELVFLTLTHGTPFTAEDELNYPEQAAFTYDKILENNGTGATQFVLQGENTIDFDSWDCIE